jgi:hypothetical protein
MVSPLAKVNDKWRQIRVGLMADQKNAMAVSSIGMRADQFHYFGSIVRVRSRGSVPSARLFRTTLSDNQFEVDVAWVPGGTFRALKS